MTAQRYVHDILQPHVLPLMQRLPGAIFQQDNARPHTAVSALLLLFLGLFDHPDNSNRAYLGSFGTRRVGHPTSLKELEARL
ncbi:transposable element Tcb2 transposase [Trichonephila clavipes]|nr:transposable element Tcb2 transposase [Trichonephila clavipes]